MSATTVFGQVGTDQAPTHNKRNAVIALIVIALFALSFFVGRATATSHVGSAAQVATHPQLSAANRAQIANDVAPTYVEVAPNGEQLSAANRAQIANDVAPATPQLSQANSASCVAGRPC
jgi:hypothetical protein